jgi:hypothetical protein
VDTRTVFEDLGFKEDWQAITDQPPAYFYDFGNLLLRAVECTSCRSCIHVLAKRKNKQKGFSKSIDDTWLQSLESLMIFICRRKNPKLANKKHTAWLDGIGIKGITASGKFPGQPPLAIQTLKNVMDW